MRYIFPATNFQDEVLINECKVNETVRGGGVEQENY